MPSTHHHHKLTRKELKQPDEFMSFVESTREFFVGNLKQVIISAIVVVGAAAIAIGTYMYERHRDRVAGEQFSTALAALNAKQYRDAETEFAALAEEEPGRRLGKLSQFYLGSAFLGDNDLPHARDALVAFVAEEHDPTFANLALTNLAVIYERMGDFAKAASAYQQASTVPGPEQVRAQLGVARMLAKQGAKDAAIAIYRAFLAAHPFVEQRQEVVESLAMLGASPVPDRQVSSAAPPGSMPVVLPGSATTPSAH
ncbi:MAG TPA: tetratricopeptide repeat protein [Candidatus Binataceae bacterium]|nr:tetratricopeptide repeat protein [Candidatus Binataceae bacterium]